MACGQLCAVAADDAKHQRDSSAARYARVFQIWFAFISHIVCLGFSVFNSGIRSAASVALEAVECSGSPLLVRFPGLCSWCCVVLVQK